MAIFEIIQDTGIEDSEWSPPTFKDCLKTDINLTFFNENEFAEWHDVDGKKVLIVMNEDGIRKREPVKQSSLKQTYDTGLYNARIVMFIRTKDYGPLPPLGKPITIDKKRHFNILRCTEQGGVYRMELERVRQK